MCSSDLEEISSVFKKAEWKEIDLSHDMDKAGLNGIFVSGYAAVGVVIAGSTSDVVSCWTDCQLQMSDLRENKAFGMEKDLYLIFIVSCVNGCCKLDGNSLKGRVVGGNSDITEDKKREGYSWKFRRKHSQYCLL